MPKVPLPSRSSSVLDSFGMTHKRGATYFSSRQMAERAAVMAGWPIDRIIEYGKGWAVQRYKSGPYLDLSPSDDASRQSNPGTREIGSHVHDYGSAYSFLVGHNNRRKLANNTTVERIGDHTMNRMMLTLKESASDVIAVVLHNTYIVAYTSDGRILLNSGGYQTTTTKQRLNQLLPPGYGIMQKDFAWYVTTPSGKYPFEDGAMLYPGAQMEYETPDREKPYASNPPRGPGKFRNDLDEVMYHITLDGADEEYGEVDGYGYHASLLANVGGAEFRRAVNDLGQDHEDAIHDLQGDGVTVPINAIVGVDSQGFVDVQYFDSEHEARVVFEQGEKDYSDWLDETGYDDY